MTSGLTKRNSFYAANAAIFLIIGILVLIVILDLSTLFGNKRGDSDSSTASQSATNTSSEEFWGQQHQQAERREQLAEEWRKQKEEERQQKASKLSSTFCQVRSEPYTRYVNLDDFLLMTEKSGEKVNLRPIGNKPPEKAKCEKIMDWCIDYWEEEDCKKIAEGKVWIGMNEDQLILSRGLPNDQNNTVGSWGIRSQWVYGNFGPYVYLEGKNDDDLKVASWQD